MKNTDKKYDAALLRQKAEEKLKKKAAKTVSKLSEVETLKLVHELEVHQIELEMQNEELILAKERAEDAANKYTTLYDFAPTGYFTLSKEGNIAELNITASQMFGKERVHLVNSRFGFFVSDDTRSTFNGFLEKIFISKAKERCDVTITTNDNPPIIVHLTGIVSENGEQCIITMVDITERKRTEEALRESNQRLGFALQGGSLGMWDWNPQTGAVVYSDLWAQMLEYKLDEVEPTVDFFKRQIHPEELAAVIDRLTAHVEGRMPIYESEHRMRTKSGNWKWVMDRGKIAERNKDGSPMRITGVIADITERKRAEEALSQERNLLRTLIDSLPESVRVYIKDSESRYMINNLAHLRSIGAVRQEDAVGKTLADFYPSEQAKRSLADEQNVIGTGQALIGKEEIVFDKELGEERWHLTSKVPLRDSVGKIVGLVGMCNDITEHKQAEDALRTSGAMHAQMISNISDVIGIIGVDGIMKYKSPNIEKWFGWKPEDLVGTDGWLTVHPDDIARIQKELFILLQNDNSVKTVEYKYKCKDGSYKDIELTATNLVNDPVISGVLMNYHDITERKKMAASLHETMAILQAAMDQSPAGIAIADAPDGRLRYVNNAGLLIRGGSRESVVNGVGIDQYVASWQLLDLDGTPLKPDQVPLARAIMFGETGGREFIIRRTDDDDRIMLANAAPIRDDEGKVTAAIVVFLDITERKHSEQLLAQEKERLSVTLRSIGDGVITTDIKGNIVMLNKAAEEMTGWRSDDASGRPLPDVFVIINELTREPCENPFEKIINTGNVVALAEHSLLISKKGREMLIADTGAPIRDSESRITGVVLVFRDMTEKQKLNDSMQRTQKLESIGVLAGGIAHDFNNMLAGIFGYLEMSKEAAAKNKFAEVPKYLNKALNVFERAKGLTQQLLTFAKGGTPVRKTMQLAPLIHHSANFALSGSNVTCQFEITDDLWTCDCDENQIGQVIDNIVINAKQAMSMGGRIVITAGNVTNQPAHPGNYVRISIKDQGIGMPNEILPKIFDPFFSTKDAGHGLGLATVYSIMKRHDGWVDVESKPGKGSTFDLFIPASEKSMPVGAGLDILEHKGNGTILVMDDEEFMLEIAGSMLSEMGYTVALAKNGEEALAIFTQAENSNHPFAASILDLTIPGGMGGKETAAAIRKIKSNSIVIASSGYSGDPVMSNPVDHGFTDRIIKPYRKKELTELMVRVMKEKKMES